MLTNQQISLAKTNWKNRKPLGLSMTFVGSIRPNCLQNQNSNPKKNPDQAEKIVHERLAEESGDTSLQPADAAVDPAENDFVFATFRALSATVLADRPIDFTDEKMLKAAVSKLNGQTVFKDHDTLVQRDRAKLKFCGQCRYCRRTCNAQLKRRQRGYQCGRPGLRPQGFNGSDERNL